MKVSHVLAALLLAAIGALALHTPSLSQALARCGPVEAQDAVTRLARRPEKLRFNPCVSDVMPSYEQGLEDPVDAVEFLGRALEILSEDAPKSHCSKKMLPRFLYLGMEHAGSTTLADELDSHPLVSYGMAKEHRYWTKFGQNVFSSNIVEYQDTFPVDCKVEKTFDATPNMFALPIKAPHEACHTYLGEEGKGPKAMWNINRYLGNGTQLLVMLRDPVKVIQSRFPGKSWQYNADYAVDFCTCFHTGLSLWMKHFPAEQFHFLRSEDLFQHPARTLGEVFDFLGVERPDYSQRQFVKSGRRRSAAQSASSSRTLKKYRQAIRPCQSDLEELTGLNLTWGTEA